MADLVRFVLLDIEGTTTSISFVQDCLFPFVQRTLAQYLNENWTESSLHADIELLRSDAADEHKNGNLAIPTIPSRDQASDEQLKQAIIRNVHYQMSIDRKSSSLKSLQGHIWSRGYETGELIGHVYQDVPAAFRRWTDQGAKLYIYSSGSVQAQKLLFGHTTEGNLLTFISGHFDTQNAGAKQEASSYRKILQDELKTAPENVLFFTDIPKEARAASAAGIETVIVIRPGNHAIERCDLDAFRTITTFDEADKLIFKKR